jgi:hypothetical protein
VEGLKAGSVRLAVIPPSLGYGVSTVRVADSNLLCMLLTSDNSSPCSSSTQGCPLRSHSPHVSKENPWLHTAHCLLLLLLIHDQQEKGATFPNGKVPPGSKLYYEVELLRCEVLQMGLACCTEAVYVKNGGECFKVGGGAAAAAAAGP